MKEDKKFIYMFKVESLVFSDILLNFVKQSSLNAYKFPAFEP